MSDKNWEELSNLFKTYSHAFKTEQRDAEARLVTERRMGRLISEMRAMGELVQAKGGRPKHGQHVHALKELGIENKTAQRWVNEFKVPEKKFRAYIRRCKAKGEEITQRGLLALAHSKPKKKSEPMRFMMADVIDLKERPTINTTMMVDCETVDLGLAALIGSAPKKERERLRKVIMGAFNRMKSAALAYRGVKAS
jgi:hypothetical protein